MVPFECCWGNILLMPHSKSTYFLYIYLKNGKEFHFNLEDKPSIVYDDAAFLVKTINGTIECKSSDVSRFMLQDKEENLWTGVKSVTQQNESVDMSSPGEVTLSGLGLHSEVRVFTLSGTLFQTYASNGDGTLRFSFDRWPRGIYVIKLGKISFIISVK